MFSMKSPISRSADVDLDDQANVKFALTALGLYDDSEDGLSPYSTERMFDSIKSYQKKKNLKVDGVINPDRETHNSLKKSLEDDEKAGSAFGDMWRNFNDMKKFRIDGADKYFHCKANYEASSRGWMGEGVAMMGDFKEMKDQFDDTLENVRGDLRANMHGRLSARSGKYKNAQEACARFRVEGITDEY